MDREAVLTAMFRGALLIERGFGWRNGGFALTGLPNSLSSALLPPNDVYELIDAGLIEKTKSTSKEYGLTDDGLVSIGKPTKAEMRKVVSTGAVDVRLLRRKR